MTSTLIAHYSTGTYPAWVSLAGDYENINVSTAPAFTGTSDNYYFGIESIIYGESIKQYGTITIYQCTVAQCSS